MMTKLKWTTSGLLICMTFLPALFIGAGGIGSKQTKVSF
jgi:hypothetical protein